jgi:cell division protein FtsQ
VSSTLRPSKPRWLATLLVGLAAIAATGGWVTRTPLFTLRTLTVTGNHRLSDAQVARLAGLSRNTNVVWLRTGVLATRIQRDPWILQARVTRSLPGTVSVSIQERRPVAVLESGRSLLLVSGDGVILGRASPSARLPSISVPGSTARIGARIPGSTAALVVARSLPIALRGKVARITQSGHGSLSLTLRAGAVVLYGDATDADAKGRALNSLLFWAKARGVRPQSIDLRAPSAPALVPGTSSG